MPQLQNQQQLPSLIRATATNISNNLAMLNGINNSNVQRGPQDDGGLIGLTGGGAAKGNNAWDLDFLLDSSSSSGKLPSSSITSSNSASDDPFDIGFLSNSSSKQQTTTTTTAVDDGNPLGLLATPAISGTTIEVATNNTTVSPTFAKQSSIATINSSPTTTNTSSSSSSQDGAIARIMDMGFSADNAKNALDAAGNNVEKAIDFLLRSRTPSPEHVLKQQTSSIRPSSSSGGGGGGGPRRKVSFSETPTMIEPLPPHPDDAVSANANGSSGSSSNSLPINKEKIVQTATQIGMTVFSGAKSMFAMTRQKLSEVVEKATKDLDINGGVGGSGASTRDQQHSRTNKFSDASYYDSDTTSESKSSGEEERTAGYSSWSDARQPWRYRDDDSDDEERGGREEQRISSHQQQTTTLKPHFNNDSDEDDDDRLVSNRGRASQQQQRTPEHTTPIKPAPPAVVSETPPAFDIFSGVAAVTLPMMAAPLASSSNEYAAKNNIKSAASASSNHAFPSRATTSAFIPSTSFSTTILKSMPVIPLPADKEASATRQKETGNDFFKKGQYGDANTCYTPAIALIETFAESLPQQPYLSHYTHPLLISLLNNRVAACLKTGENKLAVEDCNKIVRIKESGDATSALGVSMEDYKKTLLRRAVAYEALEKMDLARDDYKVLLALDPSNVAVSKGLARVIQALERGHTSDNDR